MSSCYDLSIMLEAVKQCGGGEGGPFTFLDLQSLLADGNSTKESLPEIRDMGQYRFI